MKNIIIAGLALAVVFLGSRSVRIENQRYALQNGMCRNGPDGILVDFRCLDTVETRTSWTWHLYYALID